jgi:hypothetical protein
MNKTGLAYNGGNPYGAGLNTVAEATDTIEPGTTLPTAMAVVAATWTCDTNNDAVVDFTYTLNAAAAGAPANITRVP